MRIIVCDDNTAQLNQLQDYITEYFQNKTAPEIYSYIDSALLLQEACDADMAFLDVEMPGVNGIETAARLLAANPRMIIFFVTSHVEYIDDAMRLRSFRYIMKPIDKNRFFANMDDAMVRYRAIAKTIPIQTADQTVVVSARDILCAEGSGHYTNLYTTDGVYRSNEGITHWSQQLNLPDFFKTHRSYIINMRYVSRFSPTEVLLRSGSVIVRAKMARMTYRKFTNAYFPYLEQMI